MLDRTARHGATASESRGGACGTFLLSGLLLLPAPAVAQRDGAVGVEEVVVTARRQSESLMAVPVSANVVSGEVLANAGITDLTSLGWLVPAVNLDKVAQSNVGTLTIRGIGSSGSDASTGQSVATVVDGLATSRGGFLLSGLLDVSQVEVLKGPQALFFGKDSPGGVVSIRTNGPTDTLSGYLNVGFETDAQERQVEGAISGPLTDTLRARIALRAIEMDGWMVNNATARPNLPAASRIPGYSAAVAGAPFASNASKSLAGRLTVDYKPTENFVATFRYAFDSQEDNGQNADLEVTRCPAGDAVPVYFGIPDATGDCLPDHRTVIGAVQSNVAGSDRLLRDGVPYGEYDSYVASLTLEFRSGAIDYTSVTGVADYGRDSVSPNTNAYGIYTFHNSQDFNQVSQELRAVSSFDSPVNFTAGIYFDQMEYAYYQPVLLFALPADPRNGSFLTYTQRMTSDSTSYSLFGQVRWEISDRLALDAGLRYSEDRVEGEAFNEFVNRNSALALPLAAEGRRFFAKRNFDDASPEVTLSWKPVEGTLLFASWRNGYKSGNPSDLGIIPASFTSEQLFYEPEAIEGYEVGLKSRLLDGKLRLTAAAFTYDYTDLQLSTFNTLTFQSQTLNAGGMRTEGFEVGLDYRPSAALTLSLGIAYTDATYTDFDVIGCYAGQTVAAGCRPGGTQDLAGQQKFRAPAWTGNLALLYEIPVLGDYRLGFSAALRHSDDYVASENNNPASVQAAYQVYDAGIQLRNERWRFAVLGRNLGDERYVSAALDTPNARPGTVYGTVSRPRQVWLQASFRY